MSVRPRLLAGRVVLSLALALACAVALYRARLRAVVRPPALAAAPPKETEGTGWPSAAAPLTANAALFPPGFGARRIYVDAGHGAEGNPGNTSCFCVKEQDFTLFAARELARRLEATGHFEVRLSRGDEGPVSYRERVDAAARFGADAFLSLHSDVRRRADVWSPSPGAQCPVSYGATGFAVLYADEGSEAEVAPRRTLAREAAFRLAEAGLVPYDGAEYAPQYEADPLQEGVFIDRHPPSLRIFVLYRPPMPSILLETHHALDPREAARWSEPRTLDAFAAAIAAALASVLE